MRRRARVLTLLAAVAVALPASAHAATPTRITRQTPSQGPVGSKIHVEGTGCAGGGTFEVSNGSGVEFDFTGRPDGTFAFDYPVPPAEAGEQSANSVYDTELFCRDSKRHVLGSDFEITGPTYTLDPPGAPPGATVRVRGTGCVEDGGPDDAAYIAVDGKRVATFTPKGNFAFDFTFRVPALAADRKYVVQINCLIQRIASAAGDGGQRFVVPALLLVTGGSSTAPPTTQTSAPAGTSRRPGVALAALAALVSLIAFVVVMRRRRAHRALEVAAGHERVVAVEEVAPVHEPEPVVDRDAQIREEAQRRARAIAEQVAQEAAAREQAAATARDDERIAAEEQAPLAEEAAAAERVAREEAERRIAAEEAARLAAEAEEERLAREEEARLAREEEQRRLAAEEEERLAREQREEAQRLVRLEEELLAREEEERRIAAEEAARLAREEEERLAREQREEAERLAREEEERLAREEAARLAAEEEERRHAAEEVARIEAEQAARPRRRKPLKARRLAPVRLPNGEMSFPEPPYAPQHPHELVAFGDVRVDPFYWLRERDNEDVIAYLEAENAYADAVLEPLSGLRRTLFDTIKERTKEDDTSPPVPLRGWEYYVRTAEGAQYPDSCRRPRGGADETVIIDRNSLAEGHDYLSCLGPQISPDDHLALYATDFDGSEQYTIRVKNLDTLEDFADEIPGTAGDMCWVTSDVFLYVMLDDAHRPYQVRRHVLGDDPAEDRVIYEDNDERFFVHVQRDLAGRFVFVRSGSKISNEDHFLSVDDPLGPLTVVEPRADGLEYETCDDGERLLILTNSDGAVDFKVVAAPIDNPGRRNWVDVLPHRVGTRVTDVAAFRTFTAVGERSDALTTIRIIDRATGDQHVMHHPEAVYSAEIDVNAEFDTTILRFTFTSLNTPTTWIDYDVLRQRAEVVKQTEVLGGFSPSDYVTAREWATADDGTHIPISILCRRDFEPDGTSPCLLYGYGSYEISIDPYFSIPRLNLVDRGVVFAIAHVRGGGEMGRDWYESGKMLRKRNTFTDFITCARHLVETGWSDPDMLVARGGSAGGLLMGAVANMAPELFNTVVAEVPFVDVVTTMSDDTIPLTVTEWEEWGNPRDNADDYQYMKSYSPYDNVRETDYPALYVEAGLNDSRVQYWEPAKWVAKLRVTKTDDRPLVLRTDMGAGHSGPSGRYTIWEDEARVQAFILDQIGITY